MKIEIDPSLRVKRSNLRFDNHAEPVSVAIYSD